MTVIFSIFNYYILQNKPTNKKCQNLKKAKKQMQLLKDIKNKIVRLSRPSRLPSSLSSYVSLSIENWHRHHYLFNLSISSISSSLSSMSSVSSTHHHHYLHHLHHRQLIDLMLVWNHQLIGFVRIFSCIRDHLFCLYDVFLNVMCTSILP